MLRFFFNNDTNNKKIIYQKKIFFLNYIFFSILVMQFFYGNKDITELMDKHFLCNSETKDTYYIPKNTNYNQFFSDPSPNTPKALECYDEKQNTRISIAENTSPIEISMKPPKPFNIHIVYFINIYVRANYHEIFQGQMYSLIKTNILNHPNTKLYIICSGSIGSRGQFIKETTKLLAGINFDIHYTNQNSNEFPGIIRVWEVAQQYPNDITLYFHAKGITRDHKRTKLELQCFKTVIENWKHVLYIFNTFPLINKIGCSASKEGWCWYNFWFARNSYLKHVEEPIISENRYYYEDWLCRYSKDINPPRGHEVTNQYNFSHLNDCFNLLSDTKNHFYNIGKSSHPHEANALIDQVQI